MTPLSRYCLLQVPGIVFLCALLWWVISHGWMRLDTAAWILGAWLIKDVVLYPLYRPALEDGPRYGTAALVGAVARAVGPLTPRGRVRVGGELWSAVTADGREVPSGRPVRVVGARGLTLRVEPLAISRESDGPADTAVQPRH